MPAVRIPRPTVRAPARPSVRIPRFPRPPLPGAEHRPTLLAAALSLLLVLGFVLAAERLPAAPPATRHPVVVAAERVVQVPPATSPDESVTMFFHLVAARHFTEAAQLWTPRLRGAVDPAKEIYGRFGPASQITLTRDDVVALDADQGIATVAVAWTQVEAGATHRYSGEVYLATGPNGWRWDKYAISPA